MSLVRILSHPVLGVILSKIDEDLAEQVRQANCPHCDGALHVSRYPRKPRGPADLVAGWQWRASFCCAHDGCRRRATPPSVRFLGRRVYAGVIVVLLSALCHGVSARHVRRLREEIGVDRRTLCRWRAWWTEVFPVTSFYRIARARFVPPPDVAALPLSLARRFGEFEPEPLARLLRFLSPLTTRLPDRASRKPG